MIRAGRAVLVLIGLMLGRARRRLRRARRRRATLVRATGVSSPLATLTAGGRLILGAVAGGGRLGRPVAWRLRRAVAWARGRLRRAIT